MSGQLYAAMGDALARVSLGNGGRNEVDIFLSDSGASCLALDPREPGRV